MQLYSQQDELFSKKEAGSIFGKPHHQVCVPAHIDEENEIVSIISLVLPRKEETKCRVIPITSNISSLVNAKRKKNRKLALQKRN
jgi:hypothetical protein